MQTQQDAHKTESRNSVAFKATLHCLTGCSIGEIVGMMIGKGLDLSNAETVILSVILAFLFGFLLTMIPLLRQSIPTVMALKLALASDTLSIALMEIVDNSIIMVIPGAMKATLSDQLFWISLFASLLLAGAAAFPLVRWLIGKGQGHAVIHHYHGLGGHKVSDTHADHHHHH